MLSHETVTGTSPLRSLVSELRADIVSAKAVPALATGFTSGLGLLAPYSSQGVGLVLFGNFAACLVVALAGGGYHLLLARRFEAEPPTASLPGQAAGPGAGSRSDSPS